jgi:hypothetical protein
MKPSKFFHQPPQIPRLPLPWGLEFWLPLPLLGLLFWGVGGALTQGYLQYSRRAVPPLAIARSRAQEAGVLTGKATIRANRLTEIEVIVLEPAPRLLTFYWALTDPLQIEAALARYFNQSPEAVQGWLRFELLD